MAKRLAFALKSEPTDVGGRRFSTAHNRLFRSEHANIQAFRLFPDPFSIASIPNPGESMRVDIGV
jgi:hypothetical protein